MDIQGLGGVITCGTTGLGAGKARYQTQLFGIKLNNLWYQTVYTLASN